MDDKQLLRTGMCTARASRPVVDREADGERIAAHAPELIALARRSGVDRPITIAAYAGIADEPPTRALLDALVAARVIVLLPIVAAGTKLDWAPYEGWERLATARWGLLEPTSEPRTEPALATAADLVVVPTLAVDRHGHRLGRGRGFYDRALTGTDRSRRIAVVYDEEVIARVPTEAHDQDVGWALTPGGLIELTA